MNRIGDYPLLKNTIEDTIETLATSITSSPTPRLDAQVLLSHVIQKPRAWLFTHKDQLLTSDEYLTFGEAAAQLKDGVPLPYIIGHWAFYGMDFFVSPDVLIPRPETELLVESALKWLTEHPDQVRILDVGTGSGNIAISLAYNNPDLLITVTDISPAALAVAQTNASRYQVDSRITFIQADIFLPNPCSLEIIQPPFDIITANLPYIPTETLRGLEIYGREPTLALDGGSDGLVLLRRFLQTAGDFTSPGGCILLEIEANQGKTGLKLAEDHFPQAKIIICQDLAGNDRLLIINT